MTALVDDALIALLIIGFFISFLLAFSMGANDVANAFGTSYGSRVLNFVQVCILASIFETLGSVLLGARVSDTISRGIANMDLYQDDVYELMYGYLSALVGASGWLLIATIFKLPVSGTHSIVGAVIGFTIVAHGPGGVKWFTLIKVVSSWFTSPLLSGAISSILFLIVRYFVLRRPDPIAAGSILLPILYGLTFAVISFMVINEAGVVLIAIGLGCACWLFTFLVILPWIRRKITAKIAARMGGKSETVPRRLSRVKKVGTIPRALKRVTQSAVFKKIASVNNIEEAEKDKQKRRRGQRHDAEANKPQEPTIYTISQFNRHVQYSAIESDSDSESSETASRAETSFSEVPFPPPPPNIPVNVAAEATQQDDIAETPEIRYLFSFIQVVTATFASFSHGANDVSNAVGPLVGQWQINETGDIVRGRKPEWYLLLFGGLSMSVGLILLGKRVMLTIGDDLTTISPATGFCMELGAALTVLIASHLGVPISTTHCLVGSVICVSLVRSRKTIDWRIARNIAFSWIVTVPASAFISAACMAALDAIFRRAGTFDLARELARNASLLRIANQTTTIVPIFANNTSLFNPL